VTLIIPAFNEEKGLSKLLPEVVARCKPFGWRVIVVDDASRDGTAELVKKFAPEVELMRHRVNLGYGASVKTGVRAAKTEWIATIDSDGQHRVEDLMRLAENTGDYDAVIGERTQRSHVDLVRRPGKFLLRHIANIIVGRRLKDINCGLRIIRRKAMLKVYGLTCDRFSFSTTTLVALLHMRYYVNFVPVTAEKRMGRSMVNDGADTVMLILRLVTLFDPMRIFLPIAFFLIAIGVVYQLFEFTIYGLHIQKSTMLVVLSGILCFLFALQQDQISSLRRELASFEAAAKKEEEKNAR
jgi:glycosyltransferase involved in cell wall biosynthesis